MWLCGDTPFCSFRFPFHEDMTVAEKARHKTLNRVEVVLTGRGRVRGGAGQTRGVPPTWLRSCCVASAADGDTDDIPDPPDPTPRAPPASKHDGSHQSAHLTRAVHFSESESDGDLPPVPLAFAASSSTDDDSDQHHPAPLSFNLRRSSDSDSDQLPPTPMVSSAGRDADEDSEEDEQDDTPGQLTFTRPPPRAPQQPRPPRVKGQSILKKPTPPVSPAMKVRKLSTAL